MLNSTYPKSSNDIEIANQLFEQLSISLDSRFIKHKNVASKPKLKRLLKIKYSSSISISGAFCSRCKRETFAKEDENDLLSVPEKEVEVKKENRLLQFNKKVCFAPSFKERGSEKTSSEGQTETEPSDYIGNEDRNEEKDIDSPSEPLPVFQTSIFSRRPSIIGNNEFWLPQYPCDSEALQGVTTGKDLGLPCLTAQTEESIQTPGVSNQTDLDDDQLNGVANFLQTIFQHTMKHEIKVLKVLELIDGSLGTLTEEHFFQCQPQDSTYKILDAISLKDVSRILVSDTCLMIILEVGRESALNEFKEFVPGNSEKTESFISLMVFALSRIKNFLPDVIRVPIQSLPTFENIEIWLARQNEEVHYSGIVQAENISYLDHDLLDENFMIKTSNNAQFHPVRIILRSGYLSTECNGGCNFKECKYVLSLELKSEITRIKRENQPWPNCIRIATEQVDVTLSSSSTASIDDLLEKLYFIIETNNQNAAKYHAWAFITEFYLQLFKADREKGSLCGFPLLNLEIKGERSENACIIDSEGFEAGTDDAGLLPLQNRWKLTFLNTEDKISFLAATSMNNYD